MSNWIVVVDDEAMSLTSAKTLLGSEDMKISCLRSGRELLMFMDKNDPDLILLDVMMPEMDGFETLKALRDAEQEKGKLETPVIFLTGDVDEEAEKRGLRLGASDYIHKPFNKDILIRRINNTIRYSRKIESLTEGATIDRLTGFLNKASGIERIGNLCENASGSFMVLDIDNFKLVNDLYGHDMGDRVLSSFSSVVRNNTRNDDVVCRIGGDEFAAFFNGMSDEAAINALTGRLNDQLMDEAAKLMGEDHGLPLGISIGAVFVPEYGRDYYAVFKLADEALYKAKHNGKHCCHIYSDGSAESGEGLSEEEELLRITKIIEERNDGREAAVLSTDAFAAVYRFVRRFNRRYGLKAVTVLFVVDEEGAETKNLTARYMSILKKNIRKSDVIMQNKINEFMVLFPMMDEDGIKDVIKRLLTAWQEADGSDGCGISYAVEPC
ncbi:MAG: diguanylate cyclase [Lachnospiraceae bacterium]|nr:diguanylate cyclase [Lachnospiraceae bacterium]